MRATHEGRRYVDRFTLSRFGLAYRSRSGFGSLVALQLHALIARSIPVAALIFVTHEG